MKNLNLLFFVLSFLLISCSNGNSKQTLSAENISNSILTTGNNNVSDNDTTIYERVATTAVLENAVDYFRTNNKYKDRDKNDKKMVVIKCVVEKDGSTSHIRILRDGSGNLELDNEAIRLVKQSKPTPARNENNKIVRSLWTILVHFPAE